jgi:hypothetical protein
MFFGWNTSKLTVYFHGTEAELDLDTKNKTLIADKFGVGKRVNQTWNEYLLDVCNLDGKTGWTMENLTAASQTKDRKTLSETFSAGSHMFTNVQFTSTVIDTIATLTGAGTDHFVQIRALGGKHNEPVTPTNAWPYRACHVDMQMYSKATSQTTNDAWIRSLHKLPSSGHFYNHNFKDDKFADSLGANASELKKTKAKYDPMNRINSAVYTAMTS